MTLFEQLQTATSEEDIKSAYIAALGLKNVQKNLIDIQTQEVWFEAKQHPSSVYAMFTQLLYYVNEAHLSGEAIPPLLCVIDCEKAALMQTNKVFALLQDKTIPWGKSASQCSKDTVEKVSPYLGNHFVVYRIEDDEQSFIQAAKESIANGGIIRINITPDNLRQVFDRWVAMIGRELPASVASTDYAVLFYADIMHDGEKSTHEKLPAELLHKNGQPAFYLDGQLHELASSKGYYDFWNIYHKPPEKEYRNYLLERRDSLLPIDDRQFKGAFYTPLHLVDKAYEVLAKTLGKNWQKDTIVWDMCCGVGNLEVKHSNHRNVFMSTLDDADIKLMQASKTCLAAARFQYDYLNDDIALDGSIDYSLSNKVPQGLRDAILESKENGKKILILMNPPYAEAGNSQGNDGKTDVATTLIGQEMGQYGYAKRELFVQFLARISLEIPSATIAMFSTLKYVNAPNFELFRGVWNARFKGGFVSHSKAFDGLKGNFPIGFLVWQTNHKTRAKRTPIESITVEVLDKNAKALGEKEFYHLPNESFLSEWIERLKKNDVDVIPLINTVTPTTKVENVRNKKWSNNAIAHFFCNGNDLQNAGTMTAVFSSVHSIGHAGGYFVTEKNLWQVAVVFAARLLVKHTWLNHNDQFLQPKGKLTTAFKNDCLIWMLFNGKNLTASADKLPWNGQAWSIVNRFIPFTEVQVAASGRFESDFMVQYLADKKQSKEAQAVLDAGKKLWRAYFAQTMPRKVRDELQLNRPDVGWYQVRKALELFEQEGGAPVNFEPFKLAYEALSDKLRPQVYEFGFLR